MLQEFGDVSLTYEPGQRALKRKSLRQAKYRSGLAVRFQNITPVIQNQVANGRIMEQFCIIIPLHGNSVRFSFQPHDMSPHGGHFHLHPKDLPGAPLLPRRGEMI